MEVTGHCLETDTSTMVFRSVTQVQKNGFKICAMYRNEVDLMSFHMAKSGSVNSWVLTAQDCNLKVIKKSGTRF